MKRWQVKAGDVDWIVRPTLVYLLGILLVAVLKVTESDIWLPALYLVGGIAALVAWKSISWPDNWLKYMSFGAIFLLVCVLNRALYFFDYLLSGARLDDWPFYAHEPGWALFTGEVITIIGTLLTVLAWHVAGGLRVTPGVLFQQVGPTYRLMLFAYVLSLAVFGASLAIPGISEATGQLLPTLLALGLVAAYLISMTGFRPITQLVVVSALAMPFVVAALGAGMKENLILALLPMAIVAWRVLRQPILRIGMIVTAITLIGVITAYVGHYRAEVWYQKADKPTGDVMSSFVDEMETAGPLVKVSEGIAGFLMRNNASVHRGWAVSIADEDGYYPELVFAPMVYVFVPRMLWPEKPEIRQGWEYSGVVFGERYMAWSGSSTAAGLYPSFYLGAGWFAVIAGALTVGVLLAYGARLASRVGGPVAGGLYIVALLPFMLRLDETWSVGAITGPTISLVYLLLILGLMRLLEAVFFRREQHKSI